MSKRKAVAKRGRTRGESSSNTPTFFNEEAERFMIQNLASKDGIRERGFDTNYHNIFHTIRARNWVKFTAQPEAAMMPLVKEFYANAREQFKVNPHDLRALVRGRMVAFDRVTINSLFELPDYEEDDYMAWVRSGPNFKEVIDRLTDSRGTWRMHNERHVNFPRGYLEFYSRAWHYFISARFMPSNHVSDVTKDRALLSYAIQTGLTIDVGRVIEQSITSILIGKFMGSLGHPSLICQLCLKAGVSPTGTEEVQQPLPVINDAVMEGFEKSSSSDQSSWRPPTSSTAPSSSRQETRRKKSKAPSNAELADRIDLVDARVKQVLREQRQQYEHMVALFQSCNFPHGDLPTAPTFPDISEDTDEEIDDDGSE